MRRRLLALVCAVGLLFQVGSPGARAAASVYFTAVNENILELSDATMPFWSGGYLYVAGTMFNYQELGTCYFYNSMRKLAVVYSLQSPSYALFFQVDAGTVSDGEGYGYYPPAISRNGTIFLPVGMVSNYFSLTYTSNKVENGYLIRVRSDVSVLTDSQFIDSGATWMADRYEQYQEAKNAAQQSEQPWSEETPQPVSGQTLYLCFQVSDQTAAGSLLDALDEAGGYGTFYWTAEDLPLAGDLLRRMAAGGHAVGLTVDAGAEEPVAQQLRRGNEALWEAAGIKTRLCRIENATDVAEEEARAAGYCPLAPDIDRSAYGLRSVSNANYLFSRVSTRGSAVSIWLGDQANRTGLRALLSAADGADDRAMGLKES